MKVVIFSLLVLLSSVFLDTKTQVDALHLAPTPSVNPLEKYVYIVFLSEEPPKGLSPQTYYIKLLSEVLGSEKAAKEALIYSYRIINGFAAKLTAEQAVRLEKQHGVVYVRGEIEYTLSDDYINA